MQPMHLDEEQIQRALHGELGPGTEQVLREHLRTCSECNSRLLIAGGDEDWVLELLRSLDHPPPQVSARSITTKRARPLPSWARWAAGIVLFVGLAGAAYAAPRSPLPAALRHLIDLIARAPEGVPAPAPSPQSPESQAGIAVPPGERLIIEFAGGQTMDTAVVSLTDGPDVVVRATGGNTTFTSGVDRLVVRHRGAAARLEILIPRHAPSVEVSAAGRRLWTKAGSRIAGDTTLDGLGRYVLPLSQKDSSSAP
jgi:anti-sigma factor RsiW